MNGCLKPPLLFIISGASQGISDEITDFSVYDLVSGNIVYVQSDHEKKEPASDVFLFQVTDGINTSPVFRFNFSIIVRTDTLSVLSC